MSLYMTLSDITAQLPDFAKDLGLNLSSGLRQIELTPTQLWGTAIASAYACEDKALLEAIENEAGSNITTEQIKAAKGAAAIMGMNNIYYRFIHLSNHSKYKDMPARLRMNIMKSHGADHNDFELWSLAVSAINGCGMCMEAHDRALRERGVSEDAILAAVRIAASVNAVAKVRAIN